MNIPKLAIENYQFTLVLVLLATLLGVQSFLTMPRSEDPQFDIATSRVIAVFPGANPEDVESLVVDPLETAIYELDDLKKLETTIQDGLAVVVAEFEAYADAGETHDEVIQAVAQVRPTLPAGVAAVDIIQTSPTDATTFQVALTSETASYRSLKREAERLEDAFEQVSGVQASHVWAIPDPEVRISLDLEAMRARGVTLGEVMQAVQGQAQNLPGGTVDAGTKRFTIQTSGDYDSLDEIGQTVVRVAGGQVLYLRDLATVSLAYADETHRGRFNGTRAAFVTITQREGTNIFDVQAGLDAALAAITPTLPDDIVLNVAFNQSESVDERVGGFFGSLLQGVLLVGLVVLLALGLRASVIVMLAIPSSVLIAVNWLDLADYGIQQISIVGLVIALGLLVDNAIVVTENVARYLREGYGRIEAAVAGTREVAMPIVSATATSVLAFVPIITIQSGTGDFIRSLPLTVVFALIASLAISLAMTPMLASRLLRGASGSRNQESSPPGQEGLGVVEGPGSNETMSYDDLPPPTPPVQGESFRKRPPLQRLLDVVSDRAYVGTLGWALRRPRTVVAIAFLALLGAGALFPVIGVSLFPKAGKPQFLVSIETPEGSNLNYTDRATRAVEAVLQGRDEVKLLTANIGRDNPRVYYNVIPRRERANVAQILVETHDARQVEPLVADLRPTFDAMAGMDVDFEVFENGPPVEAPIAVKVLGPDLVTLERLAREVAAILDGTEGTQNVTNPLAQPKTDLAVRIDRDKAGLLGVPIAEVDRTVLAAMNGLPLGTFRDPEGEDYDIVVRLPLTSPADGQPRRPTVDDFDRIAVASMHGGSVPLRQVATLEFEPVPTRIDHVDLARAVTVASDVDVAGGYNEIAVTQDVVRQVDALALPPGYRVVYGGKLEAQQESFSSLGGALIVALLGVLAVLVLQFRSFRQPLIIVVAIPLAVIGAFPALLLTGYTFSFTAFIGFTSLIGIVVNNSIILVDYANQLRARGRTVLEAIAEAGRTRFTPILLTTLTTIGGLLPLTLTNSDLWSPLGWVIIGGLAVSTLLTLLVVPALYRLLTPEVPESVSAIAA
ncbi:MAG: efflux RND transporter permease subunit [Bacteroidota bacterium]